MRNQLIVIAAGSAGLACASATGGSFVVPTEPEFAWTRGVAARSAYAAWARFTSTIGPNSPDAGTFEGSALAPGAPEWDVYDLSGQSFITGGGNIYAIFSPTMIAVEAPGFGLGEGYGTTILLQVRTLGTEVAPASVNADGVAPVETVELERVFLGEPMVGGGGFIVETLYRFELPGSANGHLIRFDAAEGSMSLDDVTVDLFTSADAAGCNLADVAPLGSPDGVLNVNDVIEFATAFTAGLALADVAPAGSPDGVVNVNDVIEFVNAFTGGCP